MLLFFLKNAYFIERSLNELKYRICLNRKKENIHICNTHYSF